MYDATDEARYRFSRAIAIVAVADESYRAAVEKELGVDCKGDSNYYDYR